MISRLNIPLDALLDALNHRTCPGPGLGPRLLVAMQPTTLITCLITLLTYTIINACLHAPSASTLPDIPTSHASIDKRWYGVQPLDGDKVTGECGP